MLLAETVSDCMTGTRAEPTYPPILYGVGVLCGADARIVEVPLEFSFPPAGWISLQTSQARAVEVVI